MGERVPRAPPFAGTRPGGALWRRTLLDLPREARGWRDHVIGAIIAGVYVAWLLSTARSLGFARDEGFYFRAAMDYARWFQMFASNPHEAVKQSAIDAVWSENHEHPSLMKSLFAFSWMLFHEKWHVFSDASTAFRFPGMLMMGLALWVTYLFGARAYSRRAGVMAAVLLGLMPRVFYNAHLACFDIGIVAMWTWCIYVYWRSQQEGGVLWAIAAGLVFGLALETKHNAWILPAVVRAARALGSRAPRHRPAAPSREALDPGAPGGDGGPRPARLVRAVAVDVERHGAPATGVLRVPLEPRLLQHGISP